MFLLYFCHKFKSMKHLLNYLNMKRIIVIAGLLLLAIVALWLYYVELDFFKNNRKKSVLPITTNAVTIFSDTTATLGGNITGTGYFERGVVYATTPNPTTVNNKTSVTGSETGNFNINVSGLKANTRYYVRAYAVNPEETVYGAQVRFTTTATKNASYILDDDCAETNLVFFDNHSLGNRFYVGEDGVLTSINVFAQNRTENASKHVIIDIYDAQRQLVSSSAPFALAGNDWVTVALNNVPYSDIFYVMVRWPGSEQGTHGLGYDTNGNYANAGYNWLRNNNGSWSLLHEANSQYNPGVFMIRANVNTSGTGTVKEMGRLPALATASTAVTATSVSLAGNILHAGTPPYTERGIVYCTHTNPAVTCAGKTVITGTGTGVYSTNVSNLRANTTYYARAYAINAGGIAYGNEITFTTFDPTLLPALTTNAATNIAATSATLYGNVTNAGTPEYTERGIVYCTHTNPVITCSGKTAIAGTGTGSITTDVSNLRANTTYYARAYAISADGAFYGNEITFTTPVAPDEEPTQELPEESTE